MGLRSKVDRLTKKIPPPREPIVVYWVDPATGEISWQITLVPRPGGGFDSIEENGLQKPRDKD